VRLPQARVGQPRELLGRHGQVRVAEQVAGADTEELAVLEAAQRVQARLARGERPHRLRDVLGELLGQPPGTITPGQATYDLRRLREHGLIERIPRTHRYQVTDTGLRHAMFLTRAHDRVLQAGLAQLDDPAPTALRTASRAYQAALDDLTQRAGIAA